jgi:3-dehydroquinate synthase
MKTSSNTHENAADSVRVKTGQPYTVYVTDRFPSGDHPAWQTAHTAVIVTDSNVADLYLDQVKALAAVKAERVLSYVFPAGESAKCEPQLFSLLAFLCENGVTRKDVLYALGGGVTGDLTGLAAALYGRGMRYVQLPTTLLAMTDSSVGGKTAINLGSVKNIVGTFWQPAAVICAADTLSTLSGGEFACGMAEVLKYGIIADKELFCLCEGKNRAELTADIKAIIRRCVQIKADIVAEDERDNGKRQLLNFGHTFGHAIEYLSNFKLKHGQAVAIGMMMMFRAFLPGNVNRLAKALNALSLPVGCDYPAEAVCAAALSDKKREGGNLNLIIPEYIGRCVIRSVPIADLPEIIRRGESQ